MGNKPVEKKRRKKGRPSLLDLQKRSLRLQKQQQQQHNKPNPNPNPSPDPDHNPNPNPYLRFPSSAAPRRPARRNPDPESAAEDDDEEDDGGRKREKKLKLVLRLPNRSANSASELASSGSESDGAAGDAAPRKRKIDAIAGDREKGPRQNSASKATDELQGDPSDSGPTTTPLPDKKLLVFILDRLQKKDTYGVFSEPVDPEELPDYHDIIKHPMDFGTVRKKLASGAYENLEQFEKDVFLISSNAMRYNAPDTIYFRQARSIHELSKKNFENLRQESDDNEPEPKTIRRGRPPSKNIIKRTGSDFSSDATLANAGDNSHWSNLAHDLSRKGAVLDRPSTEGVSAKASHGLRNTETFGWASEHKSERNEEYSGSMVKGAPAKYGKKPSIIDENRRNTYNKLSPFSASVQEPSVFATFDGERKLLVPVGLHMEHAYARSMARFAAKFGPIGWKIVAEKIERVLPPRTKFGRGWVGDSDTPQQSQQPPLSTSPPHPSSQPKTPPCTGVSKGDHHMDRQESPLASNLAAEATPTSASASAAPYGSSDALESAQPVRVSNHEGGFNLVGGGVSIHPKTPFQLHQNPAIQSTMNGLNTAYRLNMLSQAEKMGRSVRPPGSFGSEAAMTHARALDMVSRSNNSVSLHAPAIQLDAEKAKMVGNTNAVHSASPMPETACGSQGQWRGSLRNPKPGPVPPDLNVGFQLNGSPVSGVLVDSQQPDLALQL